MFDNIGKKIMSLAKTLALLNLIGAILAICIFLSENSKHYGPPSGKTFLIIMFCGLVGVISMWPLYGFGQIVDDIHRLRITGTGSNNNDYLNDEINIKDLPNI